MSMQGISFVSFGNGFECESTEDTALEAVGGAVECMDENRARLGAATVSGAVTMVVSLAANPGPVSPRESSP